MCLSGPWFYSPFSLIAVRRFGRLYSNRKFFAADIGSECALYYDKDFYSTVGTPTFPASGSSGNSTMLCDSGNANNVPIHPSCNNGVCNFFVSYINNSQSCASVTVTKTLTGSDPANPVLDSNGNISYDTKIVSKGYNSGGGSDCTVSGTGYTERELELNY